MLADQQYHKSQGFVRGNKLINIMIQLLTYIPIIDTLLASTT